MSKTAIINSGRNFFIKQLSENKPITLDQVIFANVSGVTGNTTVNLNGTMPPASQIVHKAAVTQAGLINDSTVVYSVILDTTVGDFSFNYIGLANAETNTLCVVMHTDEVKKIKTAGQQQGNTITESIWLEMDNASTSTGITVNAQTWQIDFSDRLAGEDESIRKTNLDLYGRFSIKDGFAVSKNGSNYTIAAGIVYIAGYRVNHVTTKTISASNGQFIYVDAWLEGTPTGRWEVKYNILSGTTIKDYISNGFQHYCEKIATIDNTGNLTSILGKNVLTSLDLSSAVNSTSETQAATSKAIKTAYDLASNAVKKSGDTMTNPLFIDGDTAGVFYRNKAGQQWQSRIFTNGDLAFMQYDPAIAEWKYKFRFVGNVNKWRFENIDDVTINGSSALKAGDGGLFSKAPVLPPGVDFFTDDVLSVSQTFTLSGTYINSPLGDTNITGTLTVIRRYYDAGAGATLEINHAGNIFYKATAYKANGVWKSYGWVIPMTNLNVDSHVTSYPIGAPIDWFSDEMPDDGRTYLYCDGSTFDKNKYPKLAKVYPSGKLPDIRGVVRRGLDNGRGLDPDRILGSYQDDASRPISGSFNPGGRGGWVDGKLFKFSGGGQQSNSGTNSDSNAITFDSSNVTPTAAENRMKNIACHVITRAN